MPNAGKAPRKKAKGGGRPRKGAGADGKSPFGKAELAHFRDLLIDRRRRILSSVTSMEQEALKAADQDFSVDHMADHGSDNFDQDLTLGLVENELRELAEIDGALARIDEGTYGICLGTGSPIGTPRLEAIPWARYSVEFQRRVEAGEVDLDAEEEDVGEEGEGDEGGEE